MPYKVEKQGSKFAVTGPDGKIMGAHDTEESAMKQMHALMANMRPGEKMMASARAFYFSELADLRESEIDAAQFVAKGVTLIRPGFSSNTDKEGRPRYYSRAVLESAKALFDGTRAFINHPRRTDSKELPERDVRDIAGYYTNIRAADDGRLLGDLKIVGQARETIWPLVEEAVKHKPDLVELSINALGKTYVGDAEGRRALVVESILSSNSADIVTTGAAGGSLAGALLHSDPDEWTGALLKAMPFEQWRESRPDYLDKLKNEWKTTRDSEVLRDSKAAVAKLETEISRLKEELQTVTADRDKHQRASLADSILESSGLPARIQKAVRAELLEKATEDEMKTVVQREQARYKTEPKPPVPVNESGTRTTERPAFSVPTPPAHPLLEAFGVKDRAQTPRDGESPEQWAKRIGKT